MPTGPVVIGQRVARREWIPVTQAVLAVFVVTALFLRVSGLHNNVLSLVYAVETESVLRSSRPQLAATYLAEEEEAEKKEETGKKEEKEEEKEEKEKSADRACQPTSTYMVAAGARDEPWIMQSYDRSRNKKTVGGDEFYLSLLDKGNPATGVLAIGHATDLQDGRYSVSFQTLLPDQQVLNGNYLVTNMMQYSCGRGFLPPPAKAKWQDGKYINRLVEVDVSAITSPPHIVPMKTAPLLDLTQFDKVIALGDSLMEQLFHGRGPKLGKLVQYVKINAPLSTDMVHSKFLSPIRGALNTTVRGTKKIALLLNSGLWDLLEDGSARRKPYISKSCCRNDTLFEDHGQALELLISTLEGEYPQVTLVWKSMTGVHVHRIGDCADQNCRRRCKYMSTSRAAQLYRMQLKAMAEKHPKVRVLDLYNLTYLVQPTSLCTARIHSRDATVVVFVCLRFYCVARNRMTKSFTTCIGWGRYNRAHLSRPRDGRHFQCINDTITAGVDVCREMWEAAFGASG